MRKNEKIKPDSKSPYSISEQLASARKKHGLTQKDLAEKTGVPESKISGYETARIAPSLSTIQRLASTLGDFFIDSVNVWIDTDNSVQKKSVEQSAAIKVLRSENARLRSLVGGDEL